MYTHGLGQTMLTLRIGSFGDIVKTLQRQLNAVGYRVNADGNFGTETRTAVEAFQADHLAKDGMPLKVDGVVGEKTWWALYNPRRKTERVSPVLPIAPDRTTGAGAGTKTTVGLILFAIGAGLLFWSTT